MDIEGVVSRDPVPRIVAIKTVVPQYRLPQDDFKSFGARMFGASLPRLEKLLKIYDTAGIETRYISVPLSFLEEEKSFTDKNNAYVSAAIPLLREATVGCLESAGLEAGDIDMIVLVSSTGIAVPTLDARLMDELPFRRSVQRLPLFGFGCAGGALGLARAAACSVAQPGSRILFLVVELSSLTFCHGDRSMKNLIATALFADGAAAMVLTADCEDGLGISSWGEYTWPDTLDVMGWDLADDGLNVLMSQSIPAIVQRHMRVATDNFLESAGLRIGDLDSFACHPGGTKVINALEEVFDLPHGHLAESRAILREYGNMSAATVIFILERILATCGPSGPGRCLMTSFGPAFCAAYLVTEPTWVRDSHVVSAQPEAWLHSRPEIPTGLPAVEPFSGVG